MKENRIKLLEEALDKLNEVKECYNNGYPLWLLTNSCCGHLRSVIYLEQGSDLDDKSLGVK